MDSHDAHSLLSSIVDHLIWLSVNLHDAKANGCSFTLFDSFINSCDIHTAAAKFDHLCVI